MSLTLPELVAGAALDVFESLPQKCKPRTHPDGRREWTPMSAVVLARGDEVTCVSLATGTKCLPASAVPKCNGTVLHDSHAEILALRAFNRWLLNEVCLQLEHPSCCSNFVGPTAPHAQAQCANETLVHPFTLKEEFSIHMFTTEAPCGDASMELLMASKPPEDAIPWFEREEASRGLSMLGRGHFSMLGVVRRKPARADAEVTLSKSCTDKLALKQFTSLLAFPLDLLIRQTSNTWLASLIVCEDQYNEKGYSRAFGRSGRLGTDGLNDAKHFGISVLPATFPWFPFEKGHSEPAMANKASNISTVWIRGQSGLENSMVEIILNGVKQGFKQFDDRTAKESALCRKQLWLKARDIGMILHAHQDTYIGIDAIMSVVSLQSYCDVKKSPRRSGRKAQKERAIARLGTWESNTTDGAWSLVETHS